MYPNEEEVDFTKLKYVLYARKSTTDESRQVRSIGDQITECRALAARLGIKVVDTIEETQSAKKPNQRPKFNLMLSNIRKGVYNSILAWNPDRLARNMLEGGEIIDMVDQEIIEDLRFVTHHFTKDANGKMLLGMAFVLSKQYSDDLSQKVSRGVKRNLMDGRTPTPKHGYINEGGHYKPDGKNFELIQDAWQMRIEGTSIDDIAVYLNNNNYSRTIKSSGRLVRMTKQTLSSLFRDSFYYGMLVQATQTVDLRVLTFYQFEPAVSEEGYFLVQKLSYRKMKPSKSHTDAFYPLRLMVYCAFCNGSMRVGPSTGGSGKPLLYYRCDNKECQRKKRSIRAKVIFDFILDFLGKGLNLTKKEYDQYYDSMTQLTAQKRQQVRQELHRLEGMQKRIQADIKERGLKMIKFDLESTVYKVNAEKMAESEAQSKLWTRAIVRLESRIRDPEVDKLSLEQFLNLSKNAAIIVQSANERVKDIICREIFLNFTVDEEKVALYQLKQPFATLLRDRKILSSRDAET